MSQDQSAGNQSEVARLLRQIDQEYEAAQRGLTGLVLGNQLLQRDGYQWGKRPLFRNPS